MGYLTGSVFVVGLLGVVDRIASLDRLWPELTLGCFVGLVVEDGVLGLNCEGKYIAVWLLINNYLKLVAIFGVVCFLKSLSRGSYTSVYYTFRL